MPPYQQPTQSRPTHTISWETLEYAYTEKNADWFWAVGLVAIALAVGAIVWENVLFAILVLVGTGTLVLHAVRKPRLIVFSITPREILMGGERHTYSSLHSFWVSNEHAGDPKRILQSQKTLSPYLVLPLGDADENEVRDYLLHYLREVEHHEPLSYKIMERLGF